MQPVTASGKAEASPGQARLIPDSPSLIPESGEQLAPSAAHSTPKRANGHAKSEDHGDVVERIPLNDGTEFEVRASFVTELERLFPAVDVPQTLREIRAWNLGKPSRRKTRKGVKAHVITWCGREQDKAGSARH